MCGLAISVGTSGSPARVSVFTPVNLSKHWYLVRFTEEWSSRLLPLTCLSLRHKTSTFLLLLAFVLIPPSLHAQRYRFKYYSHHDGLDEPQVHCLLQDRTGFLWVGTAAGLFKYDGVRFSRVGGTSLVTSLAQTPDGKLWIGARSGLAYLRDDHIQFVDLPGQPQPAAISGIAVDGGGSLYIATSN